MSSSPSGIEVEAADRVRRMLADCPTFKSWIGESVDPNSRIFDDEIHEQEDPTDPEKKIRPLALIEDPNFDNFAASIGPNIEYTTTGGIQLLLESEYLGEDVQGAEEQVRFREFKQITGQIRRELLDRLSDPLGESSYVAFSSIRTVIRPMRTPAEARGPGFDYFAVVWRFELGEGGGE